MKTIGNDEGYEIKSSYGVQVVQVAKNDLCTIRNAIFD